MIKKIATILSAMLLCIVMFTAGACSFFAEEQKREIEDIYYRPATQDEQEGIMIIIDYVGDEFPDSVFFVPNGEQGKEGNGISDVNAELTPDGGHVTITVNYTDKTRESSVFTFENSVFPTDFTCELDEETGDYNLSITLSNGKKSDFTLHNGVDGDTIENISTRYDEATGRTYIVITMSSPDSEEPIVREFLMPEGAQGDQGVGIREIHVDNFRTNNDPSNIYLVVTLTDGTELTTTIPKVNNWSVGSGAPAPGAGKYGDFYFDKDNYIIYYKELTAWTVIMDLSSKQSNIHYVHFKVGDTEIKTETINHGEYFHGKKQIPTATRPGYIFQGWYTTNEDGEIDVNSGHFTDLTPVFSDLELVPYFIPDPAVPADPAD